MHSLERIKDMLMDELDRCANKGSITNTSLETIDKLTHAVKSIDTIIAMEDAGYSKDYSYARGRRGNVRRDSMGRYSSRMYRDNGHSYRGYSRDEAKDELIDQLREIAMDSDAESRNMIERWIRQVEEV